jgi:ATP-binding cassette subfamily B protein
MAEKLNASSTPRRRRAHGGGRAGRFVTTEKAKDFKGTFKKLLHYLGAYKIAVVVVMIFAVAAVICNIAGPKILGNATTDLFNGIMQKLVGSSDNSFLTAIGHTLLMVFGLYCFAALLQFIQGWIMAGISNNISYRLRRDIDDKIMKLPFSYYDRESLGNVLSRITNDVDAIQQNFSTSVTQIITAVVTLVGIIIMMLTISWVLTIVAFLMLPCMALVVFLVVRKSQKHFFAQQNYLGEVQGIVEEDYGAHAIIKAFNGEDLSQAQFNSSNDNLRNAGWRSVFLSSMMFPLMNLIANLGYVVVCVVGAWQAVHASMPVGDIQAFIQYVRNFQQPIQSVAQISNLLQQTMAAAERVFIFLEEEEETADVSDEKAISTANVKGEVTFDHVQFGYSPEKIVIHDFSAVAHEGKKIAIVGPTGAGKTTMVKLLMRFYDVNSGAILLDGHDIREFKRDDLRDCFGMVLQDTWLYNGTLGENIRYGRLDATDEEVHDAARVAQCDHFIKTLPDGYDMVLNEDASNISAGQKQLLTIARAVLHDPKVLILDEATSSVDTRTEILIQKAMDNLMAGRTSFIIAHRLSTIRNADLILCVNHGDIVEQGTHETLLAANGFYADLYNRQFDVEDE